MQHNLVLNAQNWAVKQIIDANCEEILAKASFSLKFHCKLWCQKTIMKIQREDAAVPTKQMYSLLYFCMLRATICFLQSAKLICAHSTIEERFRVEAVIDEGLQCELGPEVS